jgi:isopentenyl-diphosphate delta-isomerase
LAVHLNPLQEVIQPEGQPQFVGGLDRLKMLIDICPVPIIIKETGAGLSKETVSQFLSLGISHFDVAGLGGTSFALIEGLRAQSNDDLMNGSLGNLFSGWGIPTAASIIECRSLISPSNKLYRIFASGGIRNGLDMAKAIAIGADYCCIAQPFLENFNQKPFLIEDFIVRCKRELATAMFLTGARSIEKLRHVPRVILPPLKDWVESRLQ